MSSDFPAGLFECFDTPNTALFSCLVPGGICCLQATGNQLRNPAASWLVPCMFGMTFLCVGVGYNRSTVRRALDIEGSLAQDILCAALCPACSMTQEWRAVNANCGNPEDFTICEALAVSHKNE